MAELNYRCLGCAAAIFPNLTKTGKVSKHPRKYCGAECKPKRERQRTPHKPKLVVCQHCFTEKYRRVRGGASDAGKYCCRGCAFARDTLISQERAAIRRIWALNRRPRAKTEAELHIAAEVAALRRIAAYKECPLVYRSICKQCDQSFTVRRTTRVGRPKTLCDVCIRTAKAAYRFTEHGKLLRRRAKARRRAMERGAEAEAVDPLAVFERDGWRCHMCRRPTPRKLRGSVDPRAPELDHIVTLAEGGTHTWGNLACACRSCNGRKGARSLGQIGLPLAA